MPLAYQSPRTYGFTALYRCLGCSAAIQEPLEGVDSHFQRVLFVEYRYGLQRFNALATCKPDMRATFYGISLFSN